MTMLQTIIAGTIVAAAASWVVWRLFVPTAWKARLRGATAPTGGCGCARDSL